MHISIVAASLASLGKAACTEVVLVLSLRTPQQATSFLLLLFSGVAKYTFFQP